MKRTKKQIMIFGISMALLWAVVFSILLKSPIGILLGILFGGAYMGTIRIMTRRIQSDFSDDSENSTDEPTKTSK